LDLLCGHHGQDRENGQSVFYTELTSGLNTINMPPEIRSADDAKQLQEESSLRSNGIRRQVADRRQEDENKMRAAQSDSGILNRVRLGLALCDSNPSPYDNQGLAFKAGDRIEILSMDPSGMWRGRVHGREGLFKFIHVKLLEEPPRRHSLASSQLSIGQQDVRSLLGEAQLGYLAPLLILNGFDSVRDILSITEDELDYLGITGEEKRLLRAATAAHLLGTASRKAEKLSKERGRQPRSSLYNRFSWHPTYARLFNISDERPQARSLSVQVDGHQSRLWYQQYKRKTSLQGFDPLPIEN
jgi:hypothetical protein